MKTLLPNEDFIFHGSEMHFLGETKIAKLGEYIAACFSDEWIVTKCVNVDSFALSDWHLITHSTASLQGVKQLDRSLFVKGVDVEELARMKVESDPDFEAEGFSEYQNGVFNGFIEGYNANKNEFTKSDMGKAFLAGVVGDKSLNEVIANLRPLSLPSSIIIEGEEIKQINW